MSGNVLSIFVLIVAGILLLLRLKLVFRSILKKRFDVDYSANVAESNRLQYFQIGTALAEDPKAIADCEKFLAALHWDFIALTYLLRNAATPPVGQYSGTERLLILDFQLLRLWVRLKHFLGIETWRSSLLEMIAILEYFGNLVGHRLMKFHG